VFPEFTREVRGDTCIWIERKLVGSTFVDRLADSDRLLADPACEIIKDQKKVTVGRLTLGVGAVPYEIYIKRYNVFSLRHRLVSPFVMSGALRALHGATVLRRWKIPSVAPLGAVERRYWGLLAKSFFISEKISGGKTVDVYWRDDLRCLPGDAGRRQRREFLVRLGELFQMLHGRAIYHNDLKDANILAARRQQTTAFFLLDLEGVRQYRRLTEKRRLKNLVQLHRTLGRYLRQADKLVVLKHYLGNSYAERRIRRQWIKQILRQSDRLDRAKAASG
jgi:tRNA A-37 threonylcarbamoyl transferase component Bud32